MILYPKSVFEAIKIGKACKVWKEKKLVSAEDLEKTENKYKHVLYMPNIFIRIGLFIFTCILAGAALGLLTLITEGGSSDIAIGIRLIIYGCITIGVQEIYASGKKIYRAGIDDALQYGGLAQIISGFCMVFISHVHSNEELLFLLIALPFLIAGAVRYVDMLLTALVFCCLLGIVFFLFQMSGLLSLVPFAGMLLSSLCYVFVKKYQTEDHLVWWDNLRIAEILSLFTFYLSGNYFVVRELSISLMRLELAEGQDIPFALIFYAFTVLIPLGYIYESIRSKDRVLLRTGLLIFALSVLTFKYYYSLGHHEITLTVAGILMIGVAWAINRYLKGNPARFTSREDDSDLNTNIESIVINENFSGNQATDNGNTFNYGGGSSGGAGASGQF